MISTDKKIEVMSQYKEGANILLKRVGAQHWSNPAIKNNIQFNWSTNEYKTKKDFVNVVLGAYVNNNLVGPNYILTNNDRVSLLYNKNKSLSLKK